MMSWASSGHAFGSTQATWPLLIGSQSASRNFGKHRAPQAAELYLSECGVPVQGNTTDCDAAGSHMDLRGWRPGRRGRAHRRQAR